MVFRRVQRDRDARLAVDGGFHRRGYSAGVGHIQPHIGVRIYSGNHHVDRLFNRSHDRKRHAVGRRAVRRESRASVSQFHLTHPQRTRHGLYVPAS